MPSEYQRQIARMLDRVAVHGPNASAAAISLLGTDMTLDEIEAAAEAVSKKAAETRSRQLFAKGEAMARRLLGK